MQSLLAIFCLALFLSAGPLSHAQASDAANSAAPSVESGCADKVDLDAQIAANKAAIARIRAADDQLARVGNSDPSVRRALAHDAQKIDELEAKNAALRKQQAACWPPKARS